VENGIDGCESHIEISSRLHIDNARILVASLIRVSGICLHRPAALLFPQCMICRRSALAHPLSPYHALPTDFPLPGCRGRSF